MKKNEGKKRVLDKAAVAKVLEKFAINSEVKADKEI